MKLVDENGHLCKSAMLELAKQLSWARPIRVYPGWQFDMDWENSAAPFHIRRKIWQVFLEEGPTPFLWDWVDGLRLELQLSNDNSKQLFVGGCAEPNELAFLRETLRPGMTFIDVGANEGIFTVLAANYVGKSGRVLAFEPSSREFRCLQRNIQLNSFNQVKTVRTAISNANGHASLRVAQSEHSGQNTLGKFCYDVVQAGLEDVPVTRLDDVVQNEKLTAVDFVKIDVEGSEADVLKGSEDTIKRHRPIILAEFNEQALNLQNASRAGLLEYLASFGYESLKIDPVYGTPAVPEEGEYSENMIVAPKEKLPAILASQSGRALAG